MPAADETLLLRADAGVRAGTGHVMRCLALAQAWQDAGGRAVFATVRPCPLEPRLRAEGCEVEPITAAPGSAADATQTADLARRHGAAWVVLDGYHLGDHCEWVLRDAGLRVLAVDDFGHADHAHADLILNQNLHADEALYPRRGPHTQLLLGTRFVLLRREFLKWRGWERPVPEVARKVLVTLGGSDPDNATATVIDALGRVDIDGLEAVVVVGAANPRSDELSAAAGRTPGVRVVRNVENMPALMAWADVAVAAGGTTTWELAFMRLPSVTIVVADNQELSARLLAEANLFPTLGRNGSAAATGWTDAIAGYLTDHPARETAVRAARSTVDGWGGRRVVEALSPPAPREVT